MNELTEAIRVADNDRIAENFRSMKRLLPADNQKGLRNLRDIEADTIQNYKPIKTLFFGVMRIGILNHTSSFYSLLSL